MRTKRVLWPGRAVLVAGLAGLFLLAFDLIGFGPNLGLPVGYFGRFNRILARVEASPQLDVVDVDLHRDVTLEDFYIAVRTPDEGIVRLRFEEASSRPFDELLLELERVGL